MDPRDPAYQGQADYTPFLLAIYDKFVVGFVAPVVWKTKVAPFVDAYRRHMGERHLDVGPGTGYFIEEADPPATTEITLLDPNLNVLDHASRRLAGKNVTTVEADVLKPLPVSGPFDSAALNMVLHCLPGPQPDKVRAIQNVAAVLTPEGVLFGGTVLGKSGDHTAPARAFLWAFNKHGGFDNLDDSVDGLRQILEDSFEQVEIDVIGSSATFVATRPRSREGS